MRSVRWYWKRFRVMRPAELGWRVAESVRLKWFRLRFATGLLDRRYAALDHRRLGFCTTAESRLPGLPFAFRPTEAEAESWLSGRWDALGFPWRWRDDANVWHLAPDSGQHWPRVFFSTIPFREGNPYGDVRVVWEPARLQQLVTLGLLRTRDPAADSRATDLICRQVESWVEGNPVGKGVHYLSAMECALRLIAVAVAVDMVRKDLLDRSSVWQCCAQLFVSHADLIERRLSLHSSAGNHTIAEGAGLVFAGVLLHEVPAARRWVRIGLKVLSDEAPRQVLPDGGGVERATWYHMFVVDLLGLVESLLVFNGRKVPSEIGMAVTRGRAFLNAMADSTDTLPRFGDADGGYALSPWLRLSFQDFGLTEDPLRVASFPDTGLTRIKIAGGQDSDLVFDHGALGMPPSFGHGHADALSLTFGLANNDIICECGTYTYTGERVWRDYFRGTRSQNTVTVDGRDQARCETAFMWTRPYAAELIGLEERTDAQILLLARHNGYRDLGVEHWRGILCAPSFMIVWDGLLGSGTHMLEAHWHLGVDVLSHNQDLITLDFADGAMTLALKGGCVDLLKGSLSPVAGWRSNVYGRKHPITTARIVYQGRVPHEFVSVLSWTDAQDVDAVLPAVLGDFRSRAGWK